jgi:hypothetical protein
MIARARFLVGCALVVAGCGGSKPVPASRTMSEAPPPSTWPVSDEGARARITTLDREIAARAMTLGLEPSAVTPGDPDGPAGTSMTDPVTPSTCERSQRPACQDVCSLSDAICAASDEICQLAGQLAGDAWAAERCAAGRGSCAAARERCCRC